ncbi:hypothetical protein A4G20_01990 [Pasteurellaceae bacterium RH1A]|nr:hypothetical protein A4G20_01990 [Pasteurellaceae bacterium RH1A]
MLYTLSQAQYDLPSLTAQLALLGQDDALLLWQDGVLQAVKNPQIFANLAHVFVLKEDLLARNLPLPTACQAISLKELVTITERFYPQVAY